MASRGIYDRSWFNYFLRCVVEASLLNGTSVVQQPLPCESSRRAIVLPFSPCKQIIPAWCNASATVRGLVYSANHVHPHDHVERRWSIVDPFCRSFRCLVSTRTSYFHENRARHSFTRQAGSLFKLVAPLESMGVGRRISCQRREFIWGALTEIESTYIHIRMNFYSLLDRCKIVSNFVRRFRSKNSFIFVSIFSIPTNRHAQRLNPWLANYYRFSVA